jgi:HupE / UreJ protein
VLGSQVRVGYNLMFGSDAQHRALVDVQHGDVGRTTVMTPDMRETVLDLQSGNIIDLIGAYVSHGAHHIWSGYDHMLFLSTLLLSAVLVWRGAGWAPALGLKDAFKATAVVVTAFTVAHSITLTAAALGIVSPPSVVVESGIAASVAIAAVNNIYPLVTRRIWLAAFCFGLLHGFGFASVLNDLGLPPARKLAALFAFNLGVELGQLTVVVILLPILFAFRGSLAYRRLVFPVGSAAIAVIGALWFIQRVTGTTIIFG